MNYELIDIDAEDIERIRDLWEGNRRYHQQRTEHFAYEYEGLDFDGRMQAIFAPGSVDAYKITLVRQEDQDIGYCLSTISRGNAEVCTLFIEQAHRGGGLGQRLMQKHMDWMKEQGCRSISVNVLVENEETIAFYQRCGFCTSSLNMKIPMK